MGMERSTFVIDADGNVAKVMRKVKPADHADDVLAAPLIRPLAPTGYDNATLADDVLAAPLIRPVRAHCARTCATPCRRGGSATSP